MDVSSLDRALLRYSNRGVADSTHRTYRSGLRRYLSFCYAFGVPAPFPVSETLLCYFVTLLAEEGAAPSTIRTYLAAVRHAQIMEGLPELRESSTFPRLRLVQSGIRRIRAETGPHRPRRLPITPQLLRRLRPESLRRGDGAASYDELLLWAISTVCFFGFFRAGELTVQNPTSFNPAVHLAWGDVSISADGQVIRLFLK